MSLTRSLPDSPTPSTATPPATPHATPTGRVARASIGIGIVLVAQLMLMLDATVVNVALPRIATDLGFTAASLSWVMNGFTLAIGGLLLLGGRLGDVFGRRRTFEIGLAVFTLASLAGGFATTPAMLIATRALQGVGAALSAPGVLALLTTSAPDEAARRRSLALFGAVTSGGATVGLLLGGVVTDLGSWRWTLFINVPIGIAVLAVLRRFVDETERRPGRFDIAGALLATSGSVLVVWSLISAPEQGWLSWRTLGGLLSGLALVAALAVVERRVSHPMIRPDLVRNPTRVLSLAVMALVVGAQFSLFFLGVQYVQHVLGYDALVAGLAFLPLTIAIFAMSRVTPRLLGRFGPAPMMITGTLGLAIGFAWLTVLPHASGYAAGLFGPLILNGICAALVFMPVTATVLTGVEPQHAGAASGLLQTVQQLGGAVGLAVIVSVYAAHAAPGQFLPGVEEAFRTASLFDLLALVGSVALLVVTRRLRVPVRH
jgi:EmrB/QacA subfamily drug resistance transporter